VFANVRSHLTYANVMASIAVFVALGGTSVAAVSLKKNSVGSNQIKNSSLTGSDVKNSSLTTSDVKNRSLLAKDFKAGQIPAGPRGATGAQGATGPAGPAGPTGAPGAARGYAHHGGNGLDTANSAGVLSMASPNGFPSIYCFDLTFTPKSVVASSELGTNGTVHSVGAAAAATAAGCPAPTTDAVVNVTAPGTFFALFN